MVRDPYNIRLRIIGYIVCGLLISKLYGPEVGYLHGCSEDFAIGDAGLRSIPQAGGRIVTDFYPLLNL